MTTLPTPLTITPWLRRDQWTRFCEVFAGDEPLPPSFDHWLRASQDSVLEMTHAGFQVRRVEIDVEALVDWCKRQHRVVDPLSMMLFVSAMDRYDDKPETEAGPQPSGKVPTFTQRTLSPFGASGPKVTLHIADETH